MRSRKTCCFYRRIGDTQNGQNYEQTTNSVHQAKIGELTHRNSVGETHWKCRASDRIIKLLMMRRNKMQFDSYSFSAIMIKDTSLFRSARSGQKTQGIASANSDALPCSR